MNNRRSIKIHIMITAAVMVFIFIQSALPDYMSGAESNVIVRLITGLTGLEAESVSFAVRKCAHFTEYLVLGLCLMQNAIDLNFRIPWPGLVIACLIGAAYAVSDELHQSLVAGRSCEIRDMIIDAAGVAMGAEIRFWIYSARRRKT